MATLAPISTSLRQPFGILNDSKLRSLQSVKNRQNAVTPSSAPTSLKRRAPSPEAEGGSDSENVDPHLLDTLHKRKRSVFGDDVSYAKSQRYSSNITPTLTSSKPRHSTTTVSTPRLETFTKPSTPASAPAAGRSPTRKRSSGLLQTRKRFVPPAFPSTKSPSLSLSAALSGTKRSRPSSRKSKHATIETSKPKSWSFDIYEESEETQDYRMNEWTMTQSATGLDISDDESKSQYKKSSSDRGKENVDPNDLHSAPVTRSMAAAAAAAELRDEMKMGDKDELRTPLGDLNPAEFYAEGLDATSVVLVHDDEEAETDVEDQDDQDRRDFTFQASTTKSSSLPTSKLIEELNGPSLEEILSSATPNVFNQTVVTMTAETSYESVMSSSVEAVADADGDVEIDVWESESAKDENERHDLPGSPGSIVGDENAFTLQEL